MTPDREKVIKGLEQFRADLKPFCGNHADWEKFDAGLSMLKERESLLGIQQTADSITFISTGTAQQGESRGLLLGKYAMHEWLKKELLYRGLLTDDIRAVFDEAERQEGR